MKSRVSSYNLSPYLFLFPTILILLILVVIPLFQGFYISLFNTNLVNRWNAVGLKNYWNDLFATGFLGKIGLTLQFSVLVVLGNLVLGTLMALVLNLKLPGQTVFRLIMTLPWLFPEVVVSMIWKWIFNPMYGILNHLLMEFKLISNPIDFLGSPQYALLGVVFVCVWKGFPLVMILVLAGLQSISSDIYEAAKIDGCGSLQSFRYVTLPGLMPVLSVTIILETVWWFKHFAIVWLLTAGGPVNATNIISIDIYKTAFEDFQFGQAAATAVIVFFICLIFSMLYRRLIPNYAE